MPELREDLFLFGDQSRCCITSLFTLNVFIFGRLSPSKTCEMIIIVHVQGGKGLCVTRDLNKNSPVTREIGKYLVVNRELLV